MLITSTKDIHDKKTRLGLQIYIFLLLSVCLSACSVSPAIATQEDIQMTAVPLATETITPMPPTATPTLPHTCEPDSSKWQFLDTDPKLNFKKIEPGCVMDSLGETIAFHLLHLYGRSLYEASVQTGINAKLQAIDPDMNLPSESPQSLGRRFGYFWVRSAIHYDVGSAANPVNTHWLAPIPYWIVDDEKPVLPTMILLGCYRTYDVVGNEKVYITPEWEGYMDVVCHVAEDVQWDWIVNTDQDKELVYSYDDEENIGHKRGGRTIIYFGYSEKFDVWIELTRDGITELYPNLFRSDDERLQEYDYATSTFGVPLWNEEWLRTKYEVEAVPLPNGWETHNTEADRQAMNTKINNP
jgi:hypothetical protein